MKEKFGDYEMEITPTSQAYAYYNLVLSYKGEPFYKKLNNAEFNSEARAMNVGASKIKEHAAAIESMHKVLDPLAKTKENDYTRGYEDGKADAEAERNDEIDKIIHDVPF